LKELMFYSILLIRCNNDILTVLSWLEPARRAGTVYLRQPLPQRRLRLTQRQHSQIYKNRRRITETPMETCPIGVTSCPKFVISTGAEGAMERSIQNRFLDSALRAALGMTNFSELRLKFRRFLV
jgi:hypothetical protein